MFQLSLQTFSSYYRQASPRRTYIIDLNLPTGAKVQSQHFYHDRFGKEEFFLANKRWQFINAQKNKTLIAFGDCSKN